MIEHRICRCSKPRRYWSKVWESWMCGRCHNEVNAVRFGSGAVIVFVVVAYLAVEAALKTMI